MPPELRSLVYGWITMVLTGIIGGIGWWIKHVTENREQARKAAEANEPQRDKIFTEQMQMLLDDCRREMQVRDDRIDRRDTEIAALKAEVDRLRQMPAQRRRATDTESAPQEGPG